MKVSIIVRALIAVILGYLLWTVFTEGGSEATQIIKDQVGDIKVGVDPDDEQQTTRGVIPQEHQRQLTGFYEALNTIKSSSRQDCFLPWAGFSELGEEGTVITMEAVDEGTKVTVQGLGGLRYADDDSQTIEGVRPCVIASTEQNLISATFHRKLEQMRNQQLSEFPRDEFGYYYMVPSVQLQYQPTTFGGGNVLSWAGQSMGFTDGIFFSPDNIHFCFFPNEGLNRAHAPEFAALARQGELPQC